MFTAEVGGEVRWWKKRGRRRGEDDIDDDKVGDDWYLAGVAPVPFGRRVLAVAHHPGSGVVLCGDQAGNIAAFDGGGQGRGAGSGPGGGGGKGGGGGGNKAAAAAVGVAGEAAGVAILLPLLAAMRGAHGSHAVSIAAVRGVGGGGGEVGGEGEGGGVDEGSEWDGVELITGGRDGRLCTYELRPAQPLSTAESEQQRRRQAGTSTVHTHPQLHRPPSPDAVCCFISAPQHQYVRPC